MKSNEIERKFFNTSKFVCRDEKKSFTRACLVTFYFKEKMEMFRCFRLTSSSMKGEQFIDELFSLDVLVRSIMPLRLRPLHEAFKEGKDSWMSSNAWIISTVE